MFYSQIENLDCSAIVVESSGLGGGVAEGVEAMTLFYNEATRNIFMNELHEVNKKFFIFLGYHYS